MTVQNRQTPVTFFIQFVSPFIKSINNKPHKGEGVMTVQNRQTPITITLLQKTLEQEPVFLFNLQQ